MQLTIRVATATVLAAGFFSAGATHAQDAAPFRERLIVLGAHIGARALLYTEAPSETAVVFTGDPIRVDVSVRNSTGEPVTLGVGQQAWTAGLRFLFERVEQNRSQPVLGIRAIHERPIRPGISVRPGTGTASVFRAVLDGDEAPGPG